MEFARVARTNYNNIDCIKVCMAIFVVATHTSLFSFIKSQEIYDAVFTALSVKVPFFFTTSGFLIWNKLWNSSREDQLQRVYKWMKKSFRLYLVWTLIYLPFTIYGFYSEGTNLKDALAIFIRNVVFVGENYYSWQLWYLLGMLVASVLLFAMLKSKLKMKTMIWVAVALAICGATLNYFMENNLCVDVCNLYSKIFKSTRNGIFQGFPYIMIGVSVAQYGVFNSRKTLWLILVISFVAHMYGHEIFTFLMTYALFSLVVQFDLPHRDDDLYKSFRLTSTTVYLIHMLWVGFFTFIIPIVNTLNLFILVVLASFSTSYLVVKNKESEIVKLLFR